MEFLSNHNQLVCLVNLIYRDNTVNYKDHSKKSRINK